MKSVPPKFDWLGRMNRVLLACLIVFASFIVRADIEGARLPLWFHLLCLVVVAVQSPRKQP